MELTEEQILQIDNYIYVCGIKYYDVRSEIVDHFANILEQKLDENPNLDFKQEIENIHRNFSDDGFQDLLKEKTKSVTKKFYKQSLQHLVTFFKLPKIIITVFVFLGLKKSMEFFEDIDNFFLILTAIAFCLMASIFIRPLWKDSTKERFLTLDMTIGFLQIFNFFVIVLNSFNGRGLGSTSIPIHNNILIGAYVILFLFFWSGEYVYHQNKKLVKEQYPNVLV